MCTPEESKTVSDSRDAASDDEGAAAPKEPFPNTAFREPTLGQLASQRQPRPPLEPFPADAFRRPILDLLAEQRSEQ